ncbi:MAG: UvrD-helicase domain-containing protein [Candidatus Eisenbacteria bacterium]
MSDTRTTADAKHRALASGEGDGLRHTYLVEAGAGTGKTTVLVNRLLALLRSGISISRIVAITFTEKAAGELKIRLRSELEHAARNAEGEDAEALNSALHQIDRAQVNTIHSFCSSLLKERPVEAGVDPNFGVADEYRRTVMLDTVWDAWLREQFSESLPSCVAEAEALGHGLDRIRELALRLIDRRDLLHLVPGPVETGDLDTLTSDMVATAAAFKKLAATECTDPEDLAMAEIESFADETAMIEHLPEETRAAYVLRQIQPRPVGKGRKDNWGEGALADIKTRAKELRGRQATLLGRLSHNAAVELVNWLRGYIEAYEREKSRQGLLDFGDLLEKARDLVRDNLDVRADFKRAFDHVLLDEFQDTDPLQCEIAFFLCEVDGGRAAAWADVELKPGKLFLVGDPKQSIYRFRRADIETYEEARAIVGRAGEVLELVENFRTRPEIVESVNAVFSEIMHPPEDGRRYQPEYAPLSSFRERAAVGPGVIVLPPAGPLDEMGTPEVRSAEARATAAFIANARETGSLRVFDRDLGEWRPVELRDVAVLFHNTLSLDAYEEAFGDYELDYRIAGGKKFYARREVKEFATVLTAIEDPHNLAAVVGALRTPFMGASDEDILLHRYRAGSLSYLSNKTSGVAAVDDAMSLLRGLHCNRGSLSTPQLIWKLFEQTSILELFLMKPSGEQRHANLVKVVEIADDLTRDGGISFGGFVRWLRNVQQLAPQEAESPLSEEGDDFVRMLTIHKAKGLEFPVVVLADLAHHTPRHDKVIVEREGEERAGRLEFGLGSEENRLATLDYVEFRDLEAHRRDAELIRLLYVGTTRARDTLIVPWFAGGRRQKGNGLLKHLETLKESAGAPVIDLAAVRTEPGPVALDATVLDLDVRHRRPTRLKIEEAAAIDPTTTNAAMERDRWLEWLSGFGDRHHEPARIITPSSAKSDEDVPFVPCADTARSSALPPGVTGAHVGTLVHAVMEKLDLDRSGAVAETTRAVAISSGLPEEAASVAAAIVEGAFRSPVLDRARSAARVWRELPFCLARDGATIEGKMDLVFEEEDGLVIVDYKTDVLGDGGTAELRERYRGQAEAYGLALAAVARLPVKEVVLFFMRGPKEEPIPVDADPESVERGLAALISGAE